MNKYVEIVFSLLIIGIIVLVAYIRGVDRGERNIIDSPGSIQYDTTYIDIVIKDTIFEPQVWQISKIDTVVVYLPSDTTESKRELHFEQKRYTTSNYDLTISGYQAKLESIQLMSSERVITKYETKYVNRTPKVQAGFVVGTNYSDKFSGFAGVKLRYNYSILNLEGTVAYSPSLDRPLIEARVGIDIFKRW